MGVESIIAFVTVNLGGSVFIDNQRRNSSS